MFESKQLKPHLENLKNSHRFIVAFSGGLDSTVLLHALTALCTPKQHQQIQAVHVNHGLSPNAKQWSTHCKKICSALSIPLKIIKVDLKNIKKTSVEAAARDARYKALADQMQKGDYLLTAHQQDDQAETLLLQLFRGAGIKGLSAMPELTVFASGWHLRPLLNCSRAELLTYAKQNDLAWIEDESNLDLQYDRNFLRQKLLPIAHKRWPSLSKTLHRAALHCAETQSLLDALAQQDLATTTGSRQDTLSIKKLCNLGVDRSKNLLRYWIHALNNDLPSTKQLEHILKDIIYVKSDRKSQVNFAGVQVRRFRDDLFVLPSKKLAKLEEISWDLNTKLILPTSVFQAKKVHGKGIKSNSFKNDRAQIKFRNMGERCQPIGRQGSHPLKKLFQEWNIPTWERDQIPLLYVNESLAAVLGYCVCEPFAAKKNEAGWDIVKIS